MSRFALRALMFSLFLIIFSEVANRKSRNNRIYIDSMGNSHQTGINNLEYDPYVDALSRNGQYERQNYYGYR